MRPLIICIDICFIYGSHRLKDHIVIERKEVFIDVTGQI